MVDACGLVATGIVQVDHVDGTSQAETYLVNIMLPNNVGFTGVRVSKGTLTGGADMLIGMDIISRGDFAVTNFNGTTRFTFRVPSAEHIDFVRDADQPRFQHGGSKKPKRSNLSGGGKRQKGKKKR